MIFNSHSELSGQHAFLSPSKYHWIRYDAQKLSDVYANHRAAERGVKLHAFAHEAISLGIRLPRTQQTLNMYVNDAIGYRMVQEQILWYSDNCFGTADTISFRKDLLRIHDLKTGITPAHMDQLCVYAAIFCLEYGKKPGEIGMELRIYQDDEVLVYIPEVDEIAHIMSTIIVFDRQIALLKAEE